MLTKTLKVLVVLSLVLILSIMAIIFLFATPNPVSLVFLVASKVVGIFILLTVIYIIKALYESTTVREVLGL